MLHLMWIYIYIYIRTSYIFAATLVTIGIQHTAYTVTEGNNIILLCTAVEAGSIAGRTITIEYETVDGSAQGIHIIFHTSNRILYQCWNMLCSSI